MNAHARVTRRSVGWVYLRYLFPPLCALLTLIALRIPCLQYTTAEKVNDPISTRELISNAFAQSREALFGAESQTAASIAFSRATLLTVVVAILLFLIGAAITIWYTVTAFRYAQHPKQRSLARIAFITLVPNRVALALWSLCLLPLPAFPRLLVIFYQSLMNYTVRLDVTFAEPLLIAVLLVLIQVAFGALLAPVERENGMDPFPPKKEKIPYEEESASDEGSRRESGGSQEESELAQRAREEQLAQIRRMFNRDDR